MTFSLRSRVWWQGLALAIAAVAMVAGYSAEWIGELRCSASTAAR